MTKIQQCTPIRSVFVLLLVLIMPMTAHAENPFQASDHDSDGHLSRQEFAGPPQAFDRMDLNNDGYLTPQEIRESRGRQQKLSSPDTEQLKERTQTQAQSSATQSFTQTERSGQLRFIDTHVHLHPLGLDKAMSGNTSGSGSRWDGRMNGNVNLDKAAVNLISRMDEQRLSKALIVVVPSAKDSPEKAYRDLRNAVKKHPNRLGLMAGGAILGTLLLETEPKAVNDTMKKHFRKEAEKLLEEGAVGFGEMISYHLCMTQRHSFKYTPPNHPLFLLLADIAAEYDVPIDMHMEAIENAAPTSERLLGVCDKNPANLSPTISDFEELLRHNRKARIVWQHIGWDNTGQMTPSLLRRLLQNHSNLYLAMRVPAKGLDSFGIPIPNRITDPDMKIKLEWKKLIEDFQNHIMLGSDEFIGPDEEKAVLAASFETTWLLVDQLPENLSAKVGWENAQRVYRLK